MFVKEKIQNGMLFLRRYWQRPQRGDSVAYKEIAGFSVGGIGVKTFASLTFLKKNFFILN